MNVKAISNNKLTHLSLCVLAALAPQWGYAQQAQENAEKEIERISIIGSNIKRASDIGTLPVTALTEKILKIPALCLETNYYAPYHKLGQ